MLEKIIKILRDYKNDDSLEVTESSTFEQLELDSLDVVQLIMDIEDAFGVTIEADASIVTIMDLMETIKNV
ncbi:MAG: phosphopantetheine-binding protein [Defluviitaleaceae bacterium]|nr:phosphopantetheine-binding protein [Defluviitaleaceae bacterium]